MERKQNTLTLQIWDDSNPEFKLTSGDTTKIPDGNYKLKDGKFPLLTVDDLYTNSNKYHTLVSVVDDKEYKIKVTGFVVACENKNANDQYGGCEVYFEDFESNGGRRRSSKKHPTAHRRRSSKSRKSRKSRATRRR